MRRLIDGWRGGQVGTRPAGVDEWAEPLLERARSEATDAEDDCPICQAEAAAERAFVAASANPDNAPAGLRTRLAGSSLCRAHAAAVLSARGRLPLAQDLLAERLGRLAALRRALDGSEGQAATRLAARRRAVLALETCPGCQVVDIAARDAGGRWGEEAMNRSAEPDRARIAQALCMRHLPLALAHAGAEAVTLACREQTTKAQRLLADVDEYFRKVDYRYSREPKGDEQAAWLRGIARVVGSRGRSGSYDADNI